MATTAGNGGGCPKRAGGLSGDALKAPHDTEEYTMRKHAMAVMLGLALASGGVMAGDGTPY